MENLVDWLEEEEEECSGAGHEQTGTIGKQKSEGGTTKAQTNNHFHPQSLPGVFLVSFRPPMSKPELNLLNIPENFVRVICFEPSGKDRGKGEPSFKWKT